MLGVEPARSLEALLTEELRLAWAASCLPSLDAMILACPDDAENVRLCKMLSSSPHFSDLLQRQTSTTDKPQLLVRMSFATFEPTYKATAPKDFSLTCASERAAFANLLAECLHPGSPRVGVAFERLVARAG
ncbi:hypothetical protein AB1Y20_011138 [Prymnesium parvum]|uniref:Uncharacterized protein n=1 Tax=Prymnesium parvum TaxID=97485 RepID=A0AB34INF5_PRYPA